MPPNAHEVQAEAGEGHVQRRNGLGCVGMCEATAGMNKLSEVRNRLDRTDFGGHEGHGSEREAAVPRGGNLVTGDSGQH